MKFHSLAIVGLLASSASAQTLPYTVVQTERVLGHDQIATTMKAPASLGPALTSAVFAVDPWHFFRSEVTNSAPFPIPGVRATFAIGLLVLSGSNGTDWCWVIGSESIGYPDAQLPELPALSTIVFEHQHLAPWPPVNIPLATCINTGVIGSGPVQVAMSTITGEPWYWIINGLDPFITSVNLTTEAWTDLTLTYEFDLPLVPADSSCASAANSTGAPSVLEAYGTNIAADNYFVLHVASAPAGKLGYFIMGQNPANVPTFGGGQGTLCVGAPLIRFSQDVLVVEADSTVTFRPDLGDLPQSTVIAAGETWSFQFWHRDANPQQTHNTSNSVAVTFQ